MKALRRSIKGEKEKNINIAPKAAIAIVPPKKVIRALYDYEARSTQELSFTQGDFFHVIGREHDTEWYEACNPALPDARGLVPVRFFQALGKTEGEDPDAGAVRPGTANKNPDHDSGYSEASSIQQQHPVGGMQRESQRSSKGAGKKGAMIYATVEHSFTAQRSDELEAQQGEAIIVIARSNKDWLVAKPIGRLGGPGLIPVTFLAIRDMATNEVLREEDKIEAALDKAGIPSVEEWKKMAAEYKNSSITLGKFAGGQESPGLENDMSRMSLQQGQGGQQGRQSSQTSQQFTGAGVSRTASQQAQHLHQQQMQPDQNQFATSPATDLFAPVSAYMLPYASGEDKFWFVIRAMLEDGRTWNLARYYEDFYDFQIALLTEFPAEAGNTGTQKRTLPYMPGPVNYVTHAITEGRQHNLDAYVKNLLAQPPYISRCALVKQFFAPREGDYEPDAEELDDYRLSQGGQGEYQQNGGYQDQGYGQDSMPRQMSGQQPGLDRQQSSVSQQQSSYPPQLKVKFFNNGGCHVVVLPSSVGVRQLKERIADRLQKDIPEALPDNLSITYETDGLRWPLEQQDQMHTALQTAKADPEGRHLKLTLHVDVD